MCHLELVDELMSAAIFSIDSTPSTFFMCDKICTRHLRLGDHGISLRLLNPIVRNQLSMESPPTPGEISEYALALNRIGAFSEALELLESLPEEDVPQVHMHKAFTHISQWGLLVPLTELRHLCVPRSFPTAGYH